MDILNPFISFGAKPILTAVAASGTWATKSAETSQWGWEFSPDVDIEVQSLLFYRPDTDAEVIRLWRTSDETLLASASVAGGSGGYGETAITPVTLSSGVTYAVSARKSDGSSRTVYHTPGGGYTLDSNITLVDINVSQDHDGYPGFGGSGDIVAPNFTFVVA